MNGAGYQNNRNWWSARQRVVVLEFPNAEDAQDWDEAGRPLDDLLPDVHVEVQ